jgi:DNA-binding CsgD family transcriptional regulator
MSALRGRLVAAQKAEPAAARGVPLGCLAQVLRAFGEKEAAPGAGRNRAAAVPGLVKQLTAREREILALLAAGTPNPRIAEELVVTLDTVKKHVSHLLGKLGAANRTEAVIRARQRSCHEHRRGGRVPTGPALPSAFPMRRVPRWARVCPGDARPRLGISAGRDDRKILMVPALGHQQAEVMAGPVTCCVASAGPRKGSTHKGRSSG